MEIDSSNNFDIANSIREVFGYVNRFQNKIFVLKLEDSLLDNPIFPTLMQDIGLLHHVGIKIIIVPGSRKTIKKKLDQNNIKEEFIDGVRITSKEVLPLVESSALEVSQKMLSCLTAGNCNGIQGNWIQASSLGVLNGSNYQCSGKIEKVNIEVITKLLDEGFIPIIPHIGWNKLGMAYNINSNEVATYICQQLDVVKLFFISAESGITIQDLDLDLDDKMNSRYDLSGSGRLSSVEVSLAKIILEKYNDQFNYVQKDYFKNAIYACEHGVSRVHLISGLNQGTLLQEVFSSRGQGTMVYANEYSSIRNADINDIPEILKIMEDYVRSGKILKRSEYDIQAKIDDYIVYSIDNVAHACGALHRAKNTAGKKVGEIAAIAVDATYRTDGLGKNIIGYLIKKAQEEKLDYVYLLTTQAEDWFYSLGFVEGSLEQLSEEKQKTYDKKRNSKVLIYKIEEN